MVENDGTQATEETEDHGTDAQANDARDDQASTAMAEPEQDAPVELGVADDHVAALTRLRKPIVAIEELIWNGLDADAKNVSVTFEYNLLGGLERILVEDDGRGMNPTIKAESFGKLGGSPKRGTPRTPDGRTMHGKEGKGRFRAFALGARVEWVSSYQDGGIVREWAIWGDQSNLRRFPNTKPRPADQPKTGTTVTITNITASEGALTSSASHNELVMRLAPYLRNYPAVKVTFDGKLLDPEAVEQDEVEHDLNVLGEDGVPMAAKLRIVEWTMDVERRLLLCTADGFARQEELAGVQAKGFDFTAYVLADVVGTMSEAELSLGDVEPRVRVLMAAAREKMREHFKTRESERLRVVIDQWKSEGAYPYEGEATTPVAQVERDVFEILALNVHQRVRGFDQVTPESKSFTFKLLRQAIETNPSSLQTILQEVLKLPKQEQDDFAALLRKTKLSGIIKAAKIVSDRLAFISGFRQLLFEAKSKELLKERSQLQKILVRELWVFGDAYMLGLDDEGLTTLLTKHANILGRKVIAEEVLDINGDKAIPDLMLHRRYAGRDQGQFDHLVVELKRPKCTIGQKEIGQIEKYALTVANDERFEKGKTRWTFVLVSNELDNFAQERCKAEAGAEFGHIIKQSHVNVYVKQWASIIQDCEWRHEFYRKQLELEMKEADGREYVAKTHSEYLPKTTAIPASSAGKGRRAAKPS